MTQYELNRAVARCTGETTSEIARMGFQPLWPVPFERDPEDCIIDWDEFDRQRRLAITSPHRPRPASC